MTAVGYGLSYYGDTEDYYGNVSDPGLGGSVQWIFLVDWDGDGLFAYNEAAYMIDAEIKRGQRYFVTKEGSGFETIKPEESFITLENKDGRFDPDNTTGPLYEKILPGRKFRLSVKDLATGTVYPIMAGFIYDIPQVTERDSVQLALRESWALLDNEVSLPIIYRNSITDVMKYLLDQAEWPNAFGRSLDTESQQVTAFAADKVNALDVLIDLGAACLGQVFCDNEGRLVFYARGQASMPSVAIDQAQVHKAIRRSQPWENLRNIIHVTANKKVKAREEPIWQTSNVIQINANSSNTIYVQHQEAIDVRVYSFYANSAANGGGVSMNAYITYSLTPYPRSLKITFTNSSGTTAYITRMVITGRPILDQPIRKTVQNALSTATYGKMIFSLDNPWLQDLNHATEYATMISNFLDEPQRTIEVQIENRSDLQFAFDLMDKIPFTSAKLGIDTTYYAGRIEHRWGEPTGQKVVTTLVMRPRLTDGTAISNDPEDPDLPYIPEADYPPSIPIDPGTPPPPPDDNPDPSGECPVDIAANGPYTLYGMVGEVLASTGVKYDFIPCSVRSSSHVNKTSYLMQCVVYQDVDGDWVEVNDVDSFYNIYAIDGSGAKLLTATKDALVGQGYQRTGYFDPPATTPVSGFMLEINGTTIGTLDHVELWGGNSNIGNHVQTLIDDDIPWTMDGAGYRVSKSGMNYEGGSWASLSFKMAGLTDNTKAMQYSINSFYATNDAAWDGIGALAVSVGITTSPDDQSNLSPEYWKYYSQPGPTLATWADFYSLPHVMGPYNAGWKTGLASDVCFAPTFEWLPINWSDKDQVLVTVDFTVQGADLYKIVISNFYLYNIC